MDDTNVMDMRQESVYVILWENVRYRDNLGDLGVDRKTIVELFFKKWVGDSTELIWLRIGTSGGLLWTRSWNCWLPRMRGIFWQSYRMLHYQEGISFIEFVWRVCTVISTIALFPHSPLFIFKCITKEQYKTLVTITQLTVILTSTSHMACVPWCNRKPTHTSSRIGKWSH